MGKVITASGQVVEGAPITEAEASYIQDVEHIIRSESYRYGKAAALIVAKYHIQPRGEILILPSGLIEEAADAL